MANQIIFIDSIAHYTTLAQGSTKVATDTNNPVAGTGAFGAPGMTPLPAGPRRINFADQSEIEFIQYIKPNASFGTWIIIGNGVGEQVYLEIRFDGSIGIYRGSIPFVGRTLLGTAPGNSIRFGIQQELYIGIVCSATVGKVRIKVDGIEVRLLTGVDTNPSGTGKISTVLCYGDGSSNIASCTYSHQALSDTYGFVTANPRTGALFPNGAGAHSDFTPNPAVANYLNADETSPDDDTTFNESTVTGNIDSYAMQDLATGVIAVIAVASTWRLKKTDANSHTVAAVLRIGGVDYVHPTPKGVPGDWAFVQWIWTLSPATGVAFTVAEVNALENGLKIIT